MMTDEKHVCMENVCGTNYMKNVWTQVHRKFGKITGNMVVQFDCLGFMVSCLVCSAAIAL